MTEVVGEIIEWVKSQPFVKVITASADKSNLASGKVFQPNKFLKVTETDSEYWWKLKVNDIAI